MNNKVIKILQIFIIYLIGVSSVQAKPLLSPYPKAKLDNSVTLAGEETQLMTKFDPNAEKSKQFEFTKLIGDTAHYAYEIKNVASLKVTKNYENALQDAGFNVIYRCSLSECNSGKYNNGKLISEKTSYFNAYTYYKKPHYIFATKGGDELKAAISLFVGQHENKTRVLLTSVDIKDIETGLISADFNAFKKQNDTKTTKPPRKDKGGSSDHPLISRYPSSYIEDYKQVDYEEFSIPIGIADKKTKKLPTLDVTGDLTQITYVVKNVSTLKIYHNYLSALVKEGFETIFSCQKSRCGYRPTVQKLGDAISISQVYNYWHQPRYNVMKSTFEGQTTYVAFFIGNYKGDSRIQLLVMRTEPLITGLIETNSDKVLEQLKQKGKASIYGVLFDYDKAVIKPESKQSLDVIAQVLEKNKKLSLYVVGHTDDKGSAEYNLDLSKRRANAVVKTLIADYGIAKTRLIPQGVGPYSPAATNKNELGRELNRRVELVERLSDAI
ncbi:OmpA family protein [Pseudoalteromonas sp. 1CM17D]|uniref:OmpA family protein n=1 Tax=Pseudoalteromonas sp. 1CM17D TaxID=2929162 RepID=UPI0020BEF84C|nr:OmpA family protein [Pseudoalteromonas sp. 1CM17D]MCK8094199.1 OmpA family protein [Pseudoalteromonas sp. 1CM17D]|tara:strand:+ start:1554 stop:3041 length:1488 start_codon:yes stop_codon:yes gene_type:complete